MFVLIFYHVLFFSVHARLYYNDEAPYVPTILSDISRQNFISIRFQYDGRPDPIAEFYRNNTKLVSGGHIEILEDCRRRPRIYCTATFRLHNPTVEDVGVYNITVRNRIDVAGINFIIEVNSELKC